MKESLGLAIIKLLKLTEEELKYEIDKFDGLYPSMDSHLNEKTIELARSLYGTKLKQSLSKETK